MNYKIDDILAGIVTYNPDIKRLKQNVSELLKQVKFLYIVDNGSNNIEQIETLLSEICNINVKIKKFENNLGIAAALKEIMDYSKSSQYKWVLSLDQDSVIEPGLVNEYLRASNNPKYQDVGMFTCLIKDRNFQDKKYEEQNQEVQEVPYCITSAAFTNVEKYNDTSGYDTSFFIDAVDFDICYSLREKGYKVCRVNYTGLYHEVGHGENRRFLWKSIVVYHQNPIRIYYFARNLKFMHRKHRQLYPVHFLIKSELALFARILIYEDSKKEKIKSFWNGIRA